MRKVIVFFIVFAFWSVVSAKNGFDSQQGFIPTTEGPCRTEVNIPDPLEDGMVIDLGPVSDDFCLGISQWQISEYSRGKFAAHPHIPLPDPLVVKCRRFYGSVKHHCHGLVNYRENITCENVTLEHAPIEDAHEVLKTEECQRTFYFGYAEELTHRGIKIGALKSHKTSMTQVSEFKRWLVKVDAPDAVLRYELMVVEAFEPSHGNARWHLDQWGRFYKGEPDVSENSCPPGDWRDVTPLVDRPFDYDSLEEAHRSASHSDYLGIAPVIQRGMNVNPTNGATRMNERRSHRKDDFATGNQEFRVTPGGPLGCVATARMIMSDDPNNSDVQALRRRMNERDMIVISYTPAWHRQHVWYRRLERSGYYPLAPNWVNRGTAAFSYREPDETSDPLRFRQCVAALNDPSIIGMQGVKIPGLSVVETFQSREAGDYTPC